LIIIIRLDRVFFQLSHSPLKDRLVVLEFKLPHGQRQFQNNHRERFFDGLIALYSAFFQPVYLYLFPYAIFLIIYMAKNLYEPRLLGCFQFVNKVHMAVMYGSAG
jgi:hypothetical protein